MVLGKFPVPGHPSHLADSRARAYCACSGADGGCLDILLSSFFSSFSHSLGYRLKYCLKGPLNPKQPTNQHHRPLKSFNAVHSFSAFLNSM